MSAWWAPWWAEWSSYRPADFLMFSPRIYWRLFGSLNQAWWPAQALLIVLPLAWLAARRRLAGEHETRTRRTAALGLALCWWTVAWAFLAQRYAPINWAAHGFALGFALQGLALLWLARGDPVPGDRRTVRERTGTALVLWSLLGHPLLAPAAGRPWTQAEVFGLAPDPTAVGTLGILLLLGPRRGLGLLWIVPMLWCALSAATLATMGSPQAGVTAAAMLLAAVAARRRPG